MFELKQGEKYVPEFYGELKSLIDELVMHQHVVIDTATLRRCRQDLAVSKFMFDLSLSLQSQVRSQILRGDSILTLTITFSKVMCDSTGADVPHAPSIKQTVMVPRRGRGCRRGRGRDFGGGRGSFGGGCDSYGGI